MLKKNILVFRPVTMCVSVLAVLLLNPLVSWGGEANTFKKITLGRPAISLTILPLIVADRKAFFKEEGLEIQWINIRSDLAMVSLISNQLDYSCAGTRSPQAAASGMPIKTVIVVNDRPQHGLIGLSEISDVKALKGKSLAVASRGSMSDFVLQNILKAGGLRLTDVNVVQIGGNDPNRMVALKNKAVDAILIGVPFDQQMVKDGFRYLGAARNHAPVTVGDLATSSKKINENPEEVTKMVRAALKGLRHVHNNKDDVVGIISSYYNLDKDLSRAAYDAVIDTFPKQGLPTKGAVENAIDISRLKDPLKADDVVDFRILNRLLKESS